jgi:hypothetical protein
LIQQSNALFAKKGLSAFINVSNTNWLAAYTFKNKMGEIDNGMRTLMLQEMIKRGILFQGAMVPCFSHQSADVDFFIEAMSESCEMYAQALEKGYQHYLVGEPTRPVFRKFL